MKALLIDLAAVGAFAGAFLALLMAATPFGRLIQRFLEEKPWTKMN
jgi:hypothetical protein